MGSRGNTMSRLRLVSCKLLYILAPVWCLVGTLILSILHRKHARRRRTSWAFPLAPSEELDVILACDAWPKGPRRHKGRGRRYELDWIYIRNSSLCPSSSGYGQVDQLMISVLVVPDNGNNWRPETCHNSTEEWCSFLYSGRPKQCLATRILCYVDNAQ